MYIFKDTMKVKVCIKHVIKNATKEYPKMVHFLQKAL